MIRLSKILLIVFVGLQGLFYALNNIVILGELLVAALSFKGAYDMFRARAASPETFDAAKTWGLMGCIMALFVWFGLFMVVGGAYFQMWQTPLGGAAQAGAFQYAMISGVVLLFVNTKN